jgi:hypothetical protein
VNFDIELCFADSVDFLAREGAERLACCAQEIGRLEISLS